MKEQVLKLDPSRPYQVEGILLAIWLPRGRGKEDVAHGLVASITACPNPACSCIEVALSVLPVDDCDVKVAVTSTSMKIERLGAPASVASPVRYLSLDMFTAVVTLKGGGDLPDDLQPFFQEPLPGWVLDHICEIWIGLRPKVQTDWKPQALEHWQPGELLSRLVAFPDRRFDRYVVDGKTYQMDTLFCVEIDCDCTEAGFVLFEVRDRKLVEVASARVPAATMIPKNIQTCECSRQLFIRVYLDWTARHAPASATLLAMRKETRSRGAELLALVKPKVGVSLSHKAVPRNAPCPCGSGKKYKRCCGAKM
jgi:hypothetical protein